MTSTVDVATVRIPTDDPGATLAADVFLPRADGPVPGIVSLLPYRRDAVGGASMWHTLDAFAAHGYACVLVDPRGMGSSDGPARAAFDPDEADDGVAAVTWAAGQPWCTGSVGMWGFSYGALLALRTASRGVAGLRAVVSVIGRIILRDIPIDARPEACVAYAAATVRRVEVSSAAQLLRPGDGDPIGGAAGRASRHVRHTRRWDRR